jgi:hypothetical protein
MSKQRYWVAASIIWLLFYLGIPEASNAITLHAWLYPLLGFIVLVELLTNTHSKYRFGISIIVSYLAFLTISKLSTSNIVAISSLYEIAGLLITWGLIRKVKSNTQEFEDALEQIIVMNHSCNYEPEESVLKHMEREIRRARRFERPLSLVSIKPEYATMEVRIHEVLKTITRELASRYKKGKIAEILGNYSKSSDIVSFQDGEFLIMLPETTKDQSEIMLSRLSVLCKESLDIPVETGIASFPDEEITFAGLVERSQLSRNTSQ